MKEASMITLRTAVITGVAVLVGTSISAQGPELSRYRGYVLAGNLASVAKAGGMRATDAKTLHERPAKLQQLEWRAPYVSTGTPLADPVRDIVFSFSDDQLFRIAVRYERDRMEGLTTDDVIESLVRVYGVPVLSSARTSRSAPADADSPVNTSVAARWEDSSSSVTLYRGKDFQEFQLVVVDKAIAARARTAREEAVRLDTQEAPQREIDRLATDAENGRTAIAKARTLNKAAFKP
jgi:hypothetical protein